jgi:hypothetical protein
MTDHLEDTEVVLPSLCPDCWAGREWGTYVPQPCASHQPGMEGADDALVRPHCYLSGSTEAGGDGNREWCDMVHRARA